MHFLSSTCLVVGMILVALVTLAVRDGILRRRAYSKLACPHCGRLFGLAAVKEGERRGYRECEKECMEALRPELEKLGPNVGVDINICHDLRIICPTCGKLTRYDQSLKLQEESES